MLFDTTISIIILSCIIIIKIFYNNTLLYLDRTLYDNRKIKHINYKIDKYQIDIILKNNMHNFYNDDKIQEMVNYSLKNGKRVRSIIALSIYKQHNKILHSKELIENYICMIEYLQASSLILDDIMDEDTYRRNELCMYKKYDVPRAQLIALMFISKAVRLTINNKLNINLETVNKVNTIFSKIMEDLCVGQFIEQNNEINIKEIIEKKTIPLMELSYVLGWMSVNYDKDIDNYINELRRISYCFGMMFQIADDFDDIEQDRKDSKKNYILKYGKEKAYNDFYNFIYEWFILSKKNSYLSISLLEIVSTIIIKTKKIYLLLS